jgi:hypothetical protein
VWPATSDILSTTQDRFFWISWSATRIEVGRVRSSKCRFSIRGALAYHCK